MIALLVRLGDVKVGVLEHFDDESQKFTFTAEYRSALIDSRPVLGQIFEDRFPHPVTVNHSEIRLDRILLSSLGLRRRPCGSFHIV